MLYKIQSIKKVYGGRCVLDIPFLEIKTGRIYTLMGPNGAGKSTLLNILALLDIPTTGSLQFASYPVNFTKKNLQTLRRKVVLVEQYPLLFTGPVWKNIEFGLKIRKIPRKKRSMLIEEALELVGMRNFYHAAAETLSGGETKRIALARGLVVKPEVLLCDEPTANVDRENQDIIIDILDRANREQKISIIFASHDLAQARRLAHHSMILQNGRLTAQPCENIFSADIIQGTARRFNCRLADTVHLEFKIPEVRPQASSIRIAIDPTRIIVFRGHAMESKKNFFTGTVEEILRKGQGIHLYFEAGIRLHVTLPALQYQALAPMVGEIFNIIIPDDAVQIIQEPQDKREKN